CSGVSFRSTLSPPWCVAAGYFPGRQRRHFSSPQLARVPPLFQLPLLSGCLRSRYTGYRPSSHGQVTAYRTRAVGLPGSQRRRALASRTRRLSANTRTWSNRREGSVEEVPLSHGRMSGDHGSHRARRLCAVGGRLSAPGNGELLAWTGRRQSAVLLQLRRQPLQLPVEPVGRAA